MTSLTIEQKNIARRLVWQCIKEHGPITINDVAKKLNWRGRKVLSIMMQLEEAGCEFIQLNPTYPWLNVFGLSEGEYQYDIIPGRRSRVKPIAEGKCLLAEVWK